MLIAALTGCGWQLRGQGDAPQHVDSLHLGGRPLDDQLRRELIRDLETLGIALKDNANQAQYSLVVLDQRSRRRTAALSGRARIAELELIEEVEFTVLASDGSEVIPPARVSDDRVFEYNEDDILATDDEAQLVRREMRANLVRQIIGYLQRIGPRDAGDATAP
ncbi:MAG: LPS assembly lipoprotein LptE [Pseudomonadota bacterium]